MKKKLLLGISVICLVTVLNFTVKVNDGPSGKITLSMLIKSAVANAEKGDSTGIEKFCGIYSWHFCYYNGVNYYDWYMHG
jgi:hypothetical protein